MQLIVNCGDVQLVVPCGPGRQHVRWLGLVVATRMHRERYPHAFRVPQRVMNHEGTILEPRSAICEVLKDGDVVTVELRQGAALSEDDLDSREWLEKAYGPQSNLIECKFRWKVGSQQEFPKLVRGDYFVHPKWQSVYPQKEFGGRFEIPIEPVDVGPDKVDWIAMRKGPPGECSYVFVMEDMKEEICKADPETLSPRGQRHHAEFHWDVPIAPEPYPEIDSRPSTASSRDGAQVDPRFEQDWEAMKLRWIESFMKVRVKDVLTEFYAILIDLFDSYAFMGLDLSTSQHTIGMDDWKHLVLSCGLLHGQPEGSLPWREVCAWFEEATGVKDGRPYLAQRLTRSQYLELLMRAAGWAMCEHPRSQHAPEPGRPPMPLDEGLFRFITDILIPVMDVYDDDPIRKDVVLQENLVVVQQHRSSMRSLYAFLAQPWPFCDGEKVVVPGTLRFVFEDALQKLEAPADATLAPAAIAAAAPAEGESKEGASAEEAVAGPDYHDILGGDDKLDPECLALVLDTFGATVERVTNCHPERLEERALLFWEFFEVLTQSCRELAAGGPQLPLEQSIPLLMQTLVSYMGLADQGFVTLPAPLLGEDPQEDAFGEED